MFSDECSTEDLILFSVENNIFCGSHYMKNYLILHIRTFTNNSDCNYSMIYICIGPSTFSMGWIIWKSWILNDDNSWTVDQSGYVSIYWRTLKIDERHAFFNIEFDIQFKYIFYFCKTSKQATSTSFRQINYIFTYFFIIFFSFQLLLWIIFFKKTNDTKFKKIR